MNWAEQKYLGLMVKTNGRFTQHFHAGKGIIFMLHRILPEKERAEFHYNKDLAVTPGHLEMIIHYLQKKKYRFISLDELNDILQSPRSKNEKFVCFTLDDGYKDNLTYGLPLFTKYQIPFTLYITNCFPNQSSILWWYLLEDYVMKHASIRFMNDRISNASEKEKEKNYFKLRRYILDLPQSQLMQDLESLFELTSSEMIGKFNHLSLTWDEITDMHHEKLVTIGAHTMNHLSLSHLEEEDMFNEVSNSKKQIESMLGSEVKHFAYPYGGLQDVNKMAMQCAKTCKFQTAVLNHPGNIFPKHRAFPHSLPRYALGEQTDLKRLETYLNGIANFSVNGFSNIIRY